MTARRIVVRLVLPVAIALGFAIVIAPIFNANGFRSRIQEALHQSLQRDVNVGNVHFSLLRGPGFEVEDVLIKDVPAAGVEPLAYVPSLQASLSLSFVWTGHLSFSNLRLEEPTVNLVKTQAAGWNVQAFMSGAPAVAASGGNVPDIQIRGGRLNFKFVDTKSVFYVRNADVDIYPASAKAIGIRFSGEPARTDRSAQGFGRVTGRGLLTPSSTTDAQLSLGLALERTNLAEIVTLFQGHDIGIHGFITATAHLTGPLAHIGITGDVQVSDLHRWDLLPQMTGDGWPESFEGDWDVHDQKLALETVAPAAKFPFVAIRVALEDYLSSPKWTVKTTLHDVPAPPLMDTARRFGVPLPEDMKVEGNVSGELTYADASRLEGQLALADGSITSGAAPAARIENAALSVKDNEFVFGPAGIQLENGESATVRAAYSVASQTLSVRVETAQLGVEQMQSGAGRLFGAMPIPLLDACRQGNWRGWVGYELQTGKSGAWSGHYELANAQMSFPDFSAPVRLTTAAIVLDGSKLQVPRFRGSLGKISVEGDLLYDSESNKPIHMRLHSPQADLSEVERLILPILRREQGLLAQLRLRRAPVPEWLKERKLEGSIEVDGLSYGDTPLGSITGRLLWEGPSLQLANLKWRQDDSEGSGKFAINLTGTAAQYRLTGHVDDSAWRGGDLSFEGSLTAAGTGTDVLTSASAEGTFLARHVTLVPETSFDAISGQFHLLLGRDPGELHLINIQATQDQDTYIGEGISQPDGRILVELNSGKRQIRQLAAGLR